MPSARRGCLLKKPAFAVLFIMLLGILMVCSVRYQGFTTALAEGNLQPAAYVPINITNTQGVSTLSPFQVKIDVNSSGFGAYEAADLSNVAFGYMNASGYPNGTVIPSWLESGNSNSSTDTVYWLKIDGIPAASQATILMEFYPVTEDILNNVTTGEAPQLSPVYGEYDNGATMFIYYTNFAGNSLQSGWAVYDPSSITYFVNNGLTVTTSVFVSGGDPQIYYTKSLSNPQNTVIDAYMNINNGSGEFLGYLYGPNGASQDTFVGGDNNVWSIHNFDGNIGSSANMSAGSLDSNWNVLSYFPSTSAGNGWLDYTHFTTYSGNFNFVDSKPGLLGEGAYQQPKSAQWFRQRALPPNGVAPTVAIGSLTSVPAVPEFPSITILPLLTVTALIAIIVHRRKENRRGRGNRKEKTNSQGFARYHNPELIARAFP